MNKNLLRCILKRMEATPNEIKFSEKELTSISLDSFNDFKKRKYLIYDQYNPEDETFIDEMGNERFIRKINNKWFSVSLEGDEAIPATVVDEDIRRYSFNMQALIKDIKAKNNLSGKTSIINERIYFTGINILQDKKIAVVLCLLNNDKQAEFELVRLKSNLPKYDIILAIIPYFTITSQILLSNLHSQSIVPTCFDDIFIDDDFTIDNRIFRNLSIPTSYSKKEKVLEIFPTLPIGTKWEDVTIEIVSEESIRISAKGISKRYTFAQIGFIDKRRGDVPDKQWYTLLDLAKENAEISWHSKHAKINMQKKIQSIRRRLKILMGITDDPFYLYKENKSYKTKFKIEDVFFHHDNSDENILDEEV